MTETYVNEKTCQVIHASLQKEQENQNKRLDKHSEEIDDLKIIVAKLTQIQEAMAKELAESKSNSGKTSFWQSKVFEWIIKTLCIIITLLTMAGIGMNYFTEYLQAIAK